LKKKKTKSISVVGESALVYSTSKANDGTRIIFCKNPEEMENDNREYWAKMTPIERLQLLNELVIAFYKESPGFKEGIGSRIYFS
jgi:hypothetical protein